MQKTRLYYVELILYILNYVLLFTMLFTFELIISNRTGKNASIANELLTASFLFHFGLFGVKHLIKKWAVNTNEANNNRSFYEEVYNFKEKNKLLTIVYKTLIVLIVFFSFTYSFQNMFMIIPNKNEYSMIRIGGSFEKLEVTSKDETYHGYGKFDKTKVSPTVIYFGGNFESSAKKFDIMKSNDLLKYYEGFNFVMIDYPSYGINDGKATTSSMQELSLAVYDYVDKLDYVDSHNIVVIGYSIGTNIASYVSSVKSPSKLVLLAPYNTMTDTMNGYVPMFYGPMKLIVRNKFDTSKVINDVECDILIIYSNNDKVIKPKNTKKLINNIDNIDNKNKLKVIELNNYSHGELSSTTKVLEEIKEFIN